VSDDKEDIIATFWGRKMFAKPETCKRRIMTFAHSEVSFFRSEFVLRGRGAGWYMYLHTGNTNFEIFKAKNIQMQIVFRKINRAVFTFTPRDEILSPGVKLAPRGELCPLGVKL
jgi:hypothetical protein